MRYTYGSDHNVTRGQVLVEASFIKGWVGRSPKQPTGIVVDNGLGPPRWGAYQDCYGGGRCLGLAGNKILLLQLHEAEFDTLGNWKCECFPGFIGDCRQRTCPTGPAWCGPRD